MSDSAFIAPDDSEMKTYFTDMLENNMDALVKRYITNGAMDKYGQIEGFFRHDMWPDGDLLVWQSDFVATGRWAPSPSAAIAKRSNC